jgi:GT2 family glycosyltransferase
MAEDTPTLAFITGHGNVGFAKACNLGAKNAAGSHFLFLNPDAVLPEGGPEALRAAGEARGYRHYAAGPKLLDSDGTEQRGSRRRLLTPWNAFVEASKLYRLAPNHPAFTRLNDHEDAAPSEPTEVPCLSGACFLTPKETWDALEGMDERYFLHVEDIDFFLRLQKVGGTALFVPAVEVRHEKSTSDADPLEIERRKKQSMNLYFATHFDNIYPKGFLTLIRAMMWTSFLGRSLKIRLRRLGGA